MIEFLVTLDTYGQDIPTKKVWSWISEGLPQLDGVCYYKHPILKTKTGITPELTFFSPSNQPIIIRCLPYQLEELEEVENSTWTVNREKIDSPLLEAEDFIFLLNSKFSNERALRKHLNPVCVLALPLISANDFHSKFPNSLLNQKIIWKDGDISAMLDPLTPALSAEDWRLTRSIIQGINPLTRGYGSIPKETTTLGDAIKSNDRIIALLDFDQEKAALQIAPGPQRIRGLAGTGKTVLLAMKASYIHQRYPDKRILFTFNTKSLYNQIRSLIAKFYRFHTGEEPDWDYLHIRHAWGSSAKSGVYSDICANLQISTMPLAQARLYDRQFPLRSCCNQILMKNITEEYDYIMVDEAQDFPPEFFKVLYRLSKSPFHRIYWVYDELQSLFGEKILPPEELFGHDENGKPLVTLDGDYEGVIEKDLVLHRSYRCPQSVLMLAHAIGLGLYNPDGTIVQMINSKESWHALGYTVESDQLIQGKKVTIYRSPDNSISPITNIYKGSQKPVELKEFQTRNDEINWIANSIKNDIRVEKVAPEQIVVICLDGLKRKEYLPPLQKLLFEFNIPSKIPGLMDDSSFFAEPGYVTLSTIFHAKGNESYIVYIMSFDMVYDYVEYLQNRNRAFTAISRSKAWVRITGIGPGIQKAKKEIQQILDDLPRFNFVFPNPDKIPSLDAETDRRRSELRKVRESLTAISNVDKNAILAFKDKDPKSFKKFMDQIREVSKDENK